MGKLDVTEVVDQTLQRKESARQAKNALSWGFFNLLCAVLLYLQTRFGSLVGDLSHIHPVVWHIECIITIAFSLSTLLNFARYLTEYFGSSVLELTAQQKVLLGIRDSDQGFATAKQSQKKDNGSPGLTLSPSRFQGQTSFDSFTGMDGSPPPLSAGSITPPYGPVNRFSPAHHQSASPVYTPNQSTSYGGSMNYMDHSMSFNKSVASPLSTTATLSPLFREAVDTSSLRSRVNTTSQNTTMNEDDCVKDMKTLKRIFKEREEQEQKSQMSNSEASYGGSASYWNYNRTNADFSPVLRRYQYQIACRSPQSTKSRDDDPDDPATYRAEQLLEKICIQPIEMNRWVENLRRWLSQTVLHRLVKQVDVINKELEKIGLEEMQIGEVSIANLKQTALTRGQHLRSLHTIIPFLDICSDQEYLMRRIRDLSQGGCMSDFRWQSGADYKGKPWEQHLPTDSVILLHLLCSYLDARLPPNFKHPDGKTFTSEHCKKTPDKPDLEKQDNLLIYQARMNPPHYKVVIGKDIWDIPKGRNNLFFAILVFLHHVKTKEHGMLGRVNLGLSGVNIMWVIDTVES